MIKLRYLFIPLLFVIIGMFIVIVSPLNTFFNIKTTINKVIPIFNDDSFTPEAYNMVPQTKTITIQEISDSLDPIFGLIEKGAGSIGAVVGVIVAIRQIKKKRTVHHHHKKKVAKESSK